MPVQNIWTNHTSGAVTFFSCEQTAEIMLGSLMNLSTPLNTETQGDDGGQTYDKTRSITSQQPIFTFATKGIDDGLEVLAPDGLCICTDGFNKYGARVFMQAREQCGQNGYKPADNEHLQYEVNWGLARPMALIGARGGDMQLSAQIDCLTDENSINAPFSILETATLPVDPNIAQFTLGSGIVSDIIFDDMTDFALDFSVALAEKLPALAQIWPRTLSTSKHLPVLTISGRNPRILANYVPGQAPPAGRMSFLGNAAQQTDTIFRFRKRANQGTFEPDASEVHVEMAMRGLAVVDNTFDASGAARGNTTIRVIGVENDGVTKSPLAFRKTSYADFQPS